MSGISGCSGGRVSSPTVRLALAESPLSAVAVMTHWPLLTPVTTPISSTVAMVSSLEAANVKLDPETGRWTAPRSIRRTFEGEKETFDNTQPLDTVVNLSTTELGRVEELVKTMNIHQLGRFIAQQKIKGSDMISRFEVERHNRFAYPVSTFILTIIGV